MSADDFNAKQRARRGATCVHFTGIQHDACKAGVKYKDVRDSRINGPYRWPCIPAHDGSACATGCAKRRLPTAEEVAAEEARIAAAFDGTMMAREAIVGAIGPFKKGDRGVAGEIPCPVCKSGELHYSRSGYNGHIHAACTTPTCVRWME